MSASTVLWEAELCIRHYQFGPTRLVLKYAFYLQVYYLRFWTVQMSSKVNLWQYSEEQ